MNGSASRRELDAWTSFKHDCRDWCYRTGLAAVLTWAATLVVLALLDIQPHGIW